MAILAYDEVMLREPRLLVPGMQPVGATRLSGVLKESAQFVLIPGCVDNTPLTRNWFSKTINYGIPVSRGYYSGAEGQFVVPGIAEGTLIFSRQLRTYEYSIPGLQLTEASFNYLTSDYISIEINSDTWTNFRGIVRISSSDVMNQVFGPLVWPKHAVLCGGSRGIELWYGGALIASNASTAWSADLPNTNVWLWVNSMNRGSTNNFTANVETALILKKQLSAADCREISLSGVNQFLIPA